MTKFILTAIICLAFISFFKDEKQVETAYQAYLLEYNQGDTEENYTYFLDVFTSTDEYDELLTKYNL